MLTLLWVKSGHWLGHVVPGAGAGPFAWMTLGGMRSAGIPFVGDGERGCKAALDPFSLHIIPLHALSVKPRGVPRVACPAARAGRGSLDAALLDPPAVGAAGVRIVAISRKHLQSGEEMDAARLPGSLRGIWEIQENT